jgi:hypothetical protein
MTSSNQITVAKWAARAGGMLMVLTTAVFVARTPGGSASTTLTAQKVGSDLLWGEVCAMGRGQIRSWVKLDQGGKPVAVGVTFDETALEGLPDCDGKRCCDGPEYAMELPRSVVGLPFKQVAINWNPRGHEPVGVYDKPHFDFHFYIMAPLDRSKITADGEDLIKTTKQLPAEQTPQDYVQAPGGVPRMGAHWVDRTSPELQGQPFTKTFIYGSYNGEITFVEPMITKAYLETKPNVSERLKLPAQYPVAGAYPTSYRIDYDATSKQYTVALEGLTAR